MNCDILKSKLILCEWNAFCFVETAFICFTLHEIKQCIVFFGTPGILRKTLRAFFKRLALGGINLPVKQPRPTVGSSSSICLLMLCHSIWWVWQRRGAQFGGGAKELETEGPVDFPMKLPKLPQTCPESCMRFYLTKRVGRPPDIIL